MNNNLNNKAKINNNEKGQSNLGFFQSIFRDLDNLIKKSTK